MIETQHIKRLLEADDRDAVLVIAGGRAQVVSADTVKEGGLVVAGRKDILRWLAGDTESEELAPSPDELRRIAEDLDRTVTDPRV
ncbi:hypothetical protein [Spirillospora sp. NPDC048819]|uniref:hypothetical protein n=1 Tax=Spirillospora sp. NPDC048819 TaxID=3155268 RepID=UPI0033C4B9D3